MILYDFLVEYGTIEPTGFEGGFLSISCVRNILANRNDLKRSKRGRTAVGTGILTYSVSNL